MMAAKRIEEIEARVAGQPTQVNGVELNDGERLTLARADELDGVEGASWKDRKTAQALRRSVERTTGQRRDEADIKVGIEEVSRIVARLGDQVMVEAEGYVKLWKDDGVLALYQGNHLTAKQVRAVAAYRELFQCVDRSGVRLSTDERTGSGGRMCGVAHMTRVYRDARQLAVIDSAVAALDPRAGDMPKVTHALLLREVVKDGSTLRDAAGGGKAWELALTKLKRSCDTIYRVLGLGLLDSR